MKQEKIILNSLDKKIEIVEYDELIQKLNDLLRNYKYCSEDTKNKINLFQDDIDQIKNNEVNPLFSKEEYLDLIVKIEQEIEKRKNLIKNFFKLKDSLGTDIIKNYFQICLDKTNEYFSKNYDIYINIEKGSYDFINELNIEELEIFIKEIEKLNIDKNEVINEMEKKNKNKAITDNINEKNEKKYIINFLAQELYYKNTLFKELLIKNGIKKNVSQKNLEALNLDELRKIN